jgi:hypothetical protein
MTNPEWVDLFIAAATAGVLTYLEIDRKFRFPEAIKRRRLLYSWLWSFVLGNAVLAGLLFSLAMKAEWVAKLPLYVRGVVVGVGYLSIIRQKFMTAAPKQKGDSDGSPVGVEYLYEAVKSAVYDHINEISIKERSDAVDAEIAKTSLGELVTKARQRIESDRLLPSSEKPKALAWLASVAGETTSTDADKKSTVATYVLFGDR